MEWTVVSDLRNLNLKPLFVRFFIICFRETCFYRGNQIQTNPNYSRTLLHPFTATFHLFYPWAHSQLFHGQTFVYFCLTDFLPLTWRLWETNSPTNTLWLRSMFRLHVIKIIFVKTHSGLLIFCVWFTRSHLLAIIADTFLMASHSFSLFPHLKQTEVTVQPSVQLHREDGAH